MKPKLILLIILIFSLIFETLIFYFLFTDVNGISTLEENFKIDYNIFNQIHFIINLLM